MTTLKQLALLGLTLGAGCREPDDTLFVRPTLPPVEIAPGLFRVTWHDAPDVVRGFTPDGQHIVYQSRDLPGFGEGWRVLTAGMADGVVREEAGAYRQGLIEPVGTVVVGTQDRLLAVWRTESVVTCAGCPPPPAVLDLTIWRLPPTDVVPFATLPPPRAIPLPVFQLVDVQCGDPPPGPFLRQIRERPAEREVIDRRTNPYGPVELPDGSAAFYSNGEGIWRYDPADGTAPADSIGPGAFPALSPDGLTLAGAVAVGLDSTVSRCTGGFCCLQDNIAITFAGWELVLVDLATGGSRTLGPGLEPAFDPLAGRLVARRSDALYWVDLGTGDPTLITGTEGGFAPAISPDGSLLAFSADRFGNADVFYVRIR
jgi:hypothetical protein